MKLRKILNTVRDACLMLGITVGLLLIIEIGLSVVFYFQDRKGVDIRASADTYPSDAAWPREFYEEWKQANHSQWQPYVYWQRKPYQGEHITINSQGRRETWNSNEIQQNDGVGPAASDSPDQTMIFMFGGSTLWGTGARDEFTIPSILAKRLAENGIDVELVNYAQSGYVSTQEVILLMRELQQGNMPDLVVFYDGINDIFSAFQQGRAGIPQNEFNREREFKLSTMDIVALLAQSLSTTRFAVKLLKQFAPAPESTSAFDVDRLASDVLDVYEKNMEIVNALAEHFSFKTVFFWQPSIFEKDRLTAFEERERKMYPEMEAFFDVLHRQLQERDLSQGGAVEFHDISTIFVDVQEPLFIDWAHIAEAGNSAVADRIAEEVVSILTGCRSKSPKE